MCTSIIHQHYYVFAFEIGELVGKGKRYPESERQRKPAIRQIDRWTDREKEKERYKRSDTSFTLLYISNLKFKRRKCP